jgi:hypothetical protein
MASRTTDSNSVAGPSDLFVREPATGEPEVATGNRNRATGGSASGIQDALAAALASAGRFADAALKAEHAAALARLAGETELAARIEKRLEAYRTGAIDRETPR